MAPTKQTVCKSTGGKAPRKQLQNSHSQECTLYWRSERNLILTVLVLWHSMKSDSIRSPLDFWFESFPFHCLVLEISQDFKTELRFQLLVLCRMQVGLPGWPFWRYQPVCYPCQMCNNYAKDNQLAHRIRGERAWNRGFLEGKVGKGITFEM
jgi:histone H3